MITTLYNVCSLYLLWIVLHYICSYLYLQYCVIPKWYGIFLSPFLVSTPHCQAMRWVIYNGGNNMQEMWITLGIWISCKILLKTQVQV
jgi:hypothetical protein